MGELSEATVSPEEYDEEYYLYACMGADRWRESDGREADWLYDGMLSRAGMREGLRVLDIGTGRGEMIVAAVRRGAAKAVGVDYSKAAIELSRTTLEQAGNPPQARALHADARALPVPDSSFDLAILADVIEHLSPGELATTLDQAYRALAPDGRIFVHTAPNRFIYDVTYRVQRNLLPRRRRRWPREPRNQHELRMHVNEQTTGSLAKELRGAGFERVSVSLGEWIYTDFVPSERARRTYYRLARVPGLRRLAVCDLWAIAHRPDGR